MLSCGPILLSSTTPLLLLDAMDTLSGVLKSIRFEGAVFLDAEFTAPWCMRGRYGMNSVKQQLEGAEHVVLFHFLTQGAFRVRLAEGGEVIDVRAGDLILFAQDDRHLMGSDLRMAPLEADTLIDAAAAVAVEPAFVPIRHGGGGVATRFVCGYLACSRSLCRPLFEALPRVLRITLGDGQTAGLVRELLRVGVLESSASRPGAQSTLAKLAELMFVEALRRHVETLPPEVHGWLAALRDVQIGRALALLHDSPERAWTVDELAREVAMSRSALATRFASLVGESPMQYLTRWRLALAARALRSVTTRSRVSPNAAATRPRPLSAALSSASSGFRPRPGARRPRRTFRGLVRQRCHRSQQGTLALSAGPVSRPAPWHCHPATSQRQPHRPRPAPRGCLRLQPGSGRASASVGRWREWARVVISSSALEDSGRQEGAASSGEGRGPAGFGFERSKFRSAEPEIAKRGAVERFVFAPKARRAQRPNDGSCKPMPHGPGCKAGCHSTTEARWSSPAR